jgi:hypothetical protein
LESSEAICRALCGNGARTLHSVWQGEATFLLAKPPSVF